MLFKLASFAADPTAMPRSMHRIWQIGPRNSQSRDSSVWWTGVARRNSLQVPYPHAPQSYMGGYHFSSPMNRMRSTFSVVSASRKKMGFLSFVPRARSHSARRWRVSLSRTIVVSMKGLDPLRKSCPPLFGAVMALTAHIFATFATTSVNISCWSICDSSHFIRLDMSLPGGWRVGRRRPCFPFGRPPTCGLLSPSVRFPGASFAEEVSPSRIEIEAMRSFGGHFVSFQHLPDHSLPVDVYHRSGR